MLLKRRGFSILGLLALLLLLSGCSKGTAHVTVNKNGSVDLAVEMKLDSRAEALISGKMEGALINRLQEDGIQLEKSQDGKSTVYQFLKTYTSFENMSPTSGGLDIIDLKLNTKDKWLYTRYDVEAQPKFNSYVDTIMDNMGTLSLSKPIVRTLLQNFAFDFKLTLPVDLFGENNATVVDGRTLTWNVTLGDSEPIKMQVYVPNVRNIAIVLIILVVAITTTIIFFVRKRKLRNIKRV
jgi:hypothetical protein